MTFSPVISVDTSDLIAYTLAPNGSLSRLLTKRALVLKDGLTLPTVDFDGADVVPSVSAVLISHCRWGCQVRRA